MQLYLYETVPCLGLGKTLGLKTGKRQVILSA